MLFETNKYFLHSLRQRKKKASFNVVLSFLFESSKSLSGISVMQNPYKKKLKWICCYLNDILPNKHTIILTLFAKSDEITAYKWVCCHLKDIMNIVFCFHFFLENISMRQKNWAAGLSEDFSFTTRVRLGLSIVKNDSDKTSYSAGCWSQSDQWLKFVIDSWLYSWACFWLSSSLISIGDSLGRTPANKTYFMLLFYNYHLIINITFNHLKCKLHIKTLSSLKGVHKICIWKQFYSQDSMK